MAGKSVARRATSGLSGGARGSGNSDELMIMLVNCAINPITLREKGVKSLYQGRVTIEQARHTVDDARNVDST